MVIATTGFALMAISLIFMFVVVAFPHAVGLETIVGSVQFYTQKSVVDNPLIGISNTALPSGYVSTPWYAPTDAGRIDQKYATAKSQAVGDGYYNYVDLKSQAPTSYLTATLFNFSIPTNAEIKGVLVQVIGHYSITYSGYNVPHAGSVSDSSIRMIISGQSSGTDHKGGGVWPVDVDSVVTYGGSSDQWGNQLTQDVMMRPDFGVGISLLLTEGYTRTVYAGYPVTLTNTVYIDMISMTATYTLPSETTSTSTYVNTYTTTAVSSTVTVTSTTTSTTAFTTTPATWTQTYTPTSYTWTQPGGTTTTTTQGSSQSTVTLSTTSAPTSPLPSVFGFSANQEYSLAGGLLTFLSGFGMSLLGLRRR
jgi:hypothetical protein